MHSAMALGFTSRGSEPRSIATQTLFLAIWFGLLTAIGEGVLALALPRLGWLSWRVLRAVSPEIFWIIPVIDLLFFCSVALILLGVRLFFRRLPVVRLVVFSSASFMFFGWLTQSGHARGKYLVESVLGLVAIAAALLLTVWFRKHEAMAILFSKRTWRWLALTILLLVIA